MDIINEIPDKKYYQVDDLLAFISIYDDENRTRALNRMLNNEKSQIKGAVCVEAGCGYAILSEQMAKLGAKHVYAVEANSRLFNVAKERLAGYPNVTVINQDIRDFEPPEPVNVLVQELFGQMLYDEDILALNDLLFTPELVLPNKAVLMGGCINSSELDEFVDEKILGQLDGVLVSGLFDDEGIDLQFPIISWEYEKQQGNVVCDISDYPGDVLYMGLEILHHDKVICRAGHCDNWSYIWTPRLANRFRLSFSQTDRGTAVYFNWEKEI